MKNIGKIRTGMAVKIFVGLIGYIAIMYIVFGSILSNFTVEELEVISEEELYSFLSSNVEIFGSIGIVVLSTYFLMGMGSLLAFFGLRGFMRGLDIVGRRGAASLATSYMLNTISYGLLLVLYYMYNGGITAAVEDSVVQNTVLGIVVIVLFIVAFIMKVMGYSTLRGTTSLDEMGTLGVKKLYKGFIFYIVSIIALFVPVVGIYAFLILLILSWTTLLGGWAKVRQSLRLEELNN